MLPKDVLEMIFILLPLQDRKAAMMVCKSWREVAELSKFWSGVCIKVTEGNLAEMPQVVGIKRLRSMVEISVKAVSEELLLASERHPGLRVLDANYCNLSSIPPNLLARVVAKLEDVDLTSTQLTNQQCQAIFRCAAGDTNQSNLKKMVLVDCDLSSVDPETLARAVAKLEDVDLTSTHLTSQQCQAIFRCAASDTKLKKMHLSGCDLSSVDPGTISGVVAKLEDVNLTSTHLTSQQRQAIFRCAACDSKLKKMVLVGCNLSSVDPESLSGVVAQLQDVDLSGTYLTSQQCQAIFRCAAGDTKLRKMHLRDCDLSSVDPENLAGVVAKLEVVDLSYTILVYLTDTYLTSQQCQAIFRCAASDTKLKKASLAYCNLSSVDPETLAEVVAKLEDVNLNDTYLSSQQCQAIFRCTAGDTNLKKVVLAACDLSPVDPETLARFVAKLEDVNLFCTQLTSQQCQAIFRFAAGDTKLKKVALGVCNLSALYPETLARVISKIEVDVSGTILTELQRDAIIAVSGEEMLEKLDVIIR